MTSTKTLIVAVAAFIYFGVLGFYSVRSHRAFLTQMNDLGNAHQAIAAAAKGDLAMYVTNYSSLRRPSRLKIHANFIFWIWALLYKISMNPEILLWLNTLACAAAGLGLYAFGVFKLKESWWAVAAPLTFYLSPMVQDANLFDYHSITFGTAFLVWMIWAFESNRLRTAWVLAFFCLICEEKMALLMALYGLSLLVRERRKLGAALTLIPLGYFAITLTVLVPLLTRGQEFTGPGSIRYGWLLHADLAKIVTTILRPDRLRLPLYFIAAGAIAGTGAWPFLLMLVHPVAESMLAVNAWTSRISGSYYWITTAAVITIACVASAADKKNMWPLRYLTGATIFFSLFLSPLPYGVWSYSANFTVQPHRDTLQRIAEKIPLSAIVCAQNNIGPQLSNHLQISTMPRCREDSEYFVFHLRYVPGPSTGLSAKSVIPILYQSKLDEIVQAVRWHIDHDYSLVLAENGFWVFSHEPASLNQKQKQALLDQLASDQQIFLSEAARMKQTKKIPAYLTGGFTWELLWRGLTNSGPEQKKN